MTLKEARTALGWTQQELSAKSGVGQQRISSLEKGEIGAISHETVQRLVRAFNKAGLKRLTGMQLFPVSFEKRAS